MRDARTAAAPARPSPPGSTPPPPSARARTPSSGWMPGRCTSSTRPAAATCRSPVTAAGAAVSIQPPPDSADAAEPQAAAPDAAAEPQAAAPDAAGSGDVQAVPDQAGPPPEAT